MSTLKVDNLLNSAGNESPISVPGAAKAWANFDGAVSDIGSTLNSHNIGSLIDHGEGDYTLNFTNNFANSNYAVIASSHDDNAANNGYGYGLVSNNNAWIGGTYYTASSARVTFGYAGNASLGNQRRVMLAVFGD